MKILDRYILKRYLVTFLFTLLILIPIAIAIDIAEKIDKFLYHDDLTFYQIANEYYKNFIIYYTNTFMPLAVFIAVIFFTSKLANNTEIVAINSSRISFKRLLYPYFIGATIIATLALIMNHYAVPNSSKIRKNFEKKYLKRQQYEDDLITNFSLQLNDSTYMFVQSYDLQQKRGYNFSIEKYHGLKLKYKLTSSDFKWNQKDKTFSLLNWRKRKIFKNRDSIFFGNKIDTTFSFTPKDFVYKSVLAQEMPSNELSALIEVSHKRGIKNLNPYLVELYKRTSLPIATYILTLIAVLLSVKKRRGGMGINLAIGIAIMFIYVFFLKVSEVLGAVAGANSLLNIWMPNVVFAGLGFYLFLKTKK